MRTQSADTSPEIEQFQVAGRAPCGVTLLGTTNSVPALALKVKFF